jgi:hypothetical protein
LTSGRSPTSFSKGEMLQIDLSLPRFLCADCENTRSYIADQEIPSNVSPSSRRPLRRLSCSAARAASAAAPTPAACRGVRLRRFTKESCVWPLQMQRGGDPSMNEGLAPFHSSILKGVFKTNVINAPMPSSPVQVAEAH